MFEILGVSNRIELKVFYRAVAGVNVMLAIF